MVISDNLYTVDEFEAYAQQHPEQLLELIDGRIVEKVTSEEHGKIAGLIIYAIIAYLKHYPEIKGHWAVESSYRPADVEHNARRPDVSFRRTEDKVSKSGTFSGMPDFQMAVTDVFEV